MKQYLTSVFVLLATALPAFAGNGSIETSEPWARASIGVNRPGAAYMTLRNTGGAPVVLTGIATDLSGRPEVHNVTTDASGVSSMTPAGPVEIAPGTEVTLQPGGLHLMLMMLLRPMVEGETFTVTLQFEDGGSHDVEVPIHGVAYRGPGK